MINSKKEVQCVSLSRDNFLSVSTDDFIKKFFITSDDMNKLRDKNGALRSIEINEVINDCECYARIVPALIKEVVMSQGQTVESSYLLSDNEYLIYQGLESLAIKSDEGRYDVSFTIFELTAELKFLGKKFTYNEVVKSLDILSGSPINLEAKGPLNVYCSSAFLSIKFDSIDDYSDANKIWNVKFHSFIQKSISSKKDVLLLT